MLAGKTSDEYTWLGTNRYVGILTIVLYSGALFVAGYLTGYNSFPCTASPSMPTVEKVSTSTLLPAEVNTASTGLGNKGCAPCVPLVGQPSVFGDGDLDKTLAPMACNAQKALEDLTALNGKAERLRKIARKQLNQDKVRKKAFEMKVLKAEEDERAFRFCVESMMPELLRVWEIKKKDGTLPWAEVDRKGISYATLKATAEAMDPTTRMETDDARRMQMGLGVLMNKLSNGNNGQLTQEQLQQLKSLHEQLGKHLQ